MKNSYTRLEILNLKNSLVSLVKKLKMSNIPEYANEYVNGIEQEIEHYDTVLARLQSPDDVISDLKLCQGFNQTEVLISQIEKSLRR